MSHRIAVCSIILAAITTSASGSVLDQSYVVPDGVGGIAMSVGGSNEYRSKIELSQSFTVGVDGRLAQADLFLAGGQLHSDLLLEFRRTLPDGLPSEAPGDLIGAVITEYKGGPSPHYNWIEFNFNGKGPMVTAGEQLALVLKVPGSDTLMWTGGWTGDYGGGRAASRGSSPSQEEWSSSAIPYADLNFKTFVEPVPEPSTLSIFVVGGIGAIAVARRRVRERTEDQG